MGDPLTPRCYDETKTNSMFALKTSCGTTGHGMIVKLVQNRSQKSFRSFKSTREALREKQGRPNWGSSKEQIVGEGVNVNLLRAFSSSDIAREQIY